mgnify:CR=1 FL=1
MKKYIYSLVALFAAFNVTAQVTIDRSNAPTPGPARIPTIASYETSELKNGLKVLMVENHKLPRVSVSLLIDNPPKIGSSKNGIYSLTSSMLGKGSKSITKDTFIEEIDFLGATLSVNARTP